MCLRCLVPHFLCFFGSKHHICRFKPHFCWLKSKLCCFNHVFTIFCWVKLQFVVVKTPIHPASRCTSPSRCHYRWTSVDPSSELRRRGHGSPSISIRLFKEKALGERERERLNFFTLIHDREFTMLPAGSRRPPMWKSYLVRFYSLDWWYDIGLGAM